MPKQTRPDRSPLHRLQWLALTALAVAVVTGSLFTTGCALNSSSGNDTSSTAGPNPTPSSTTAPTISSIQPSSGPQAGGTAVTILGTNFSGSVTVSFGTATAAGTVVSPTQISVNAPASNTVGVVDVSVTGSNGVGFFARGFEYISSPPAPAINTVTPNSGPLAGGQLVTLTGANFQPDDTVRFGAAQATSVSILSGSQLTCVTPAGSAAGPVTVSVASATNGSASLSNGYTYNPVMTVTGVAPPSGNISGNQSVTISGTNFANITSVQFGTTNAVTFTFVNATTITAVTPVQSRSGAVNVVVTSSSAGVATLTGGYTYNDLAATPRQSSSIAMAESINQLFVCNPENNTVSLFDASGSATPTKLAEVAVGGEPRSVAVFPSGNKAYVANARSKSVSVLVPTGRVSTTIAVGVEPRAVVLSPNGTRCYVANAMSNSISIIDTAQDKVISTVDLSAFTLASAAGGLTGGNGGASQPRALAMTNNGDTNDTDETLYVAMFFAERRPAKTNLDEGQDDERRGIVIKMNADGSSPSSIPLNPIVPVSFGLGLGGPDGTGFNSNGTVLAQLATTNGANGASPTSLPKNPPALIQPTGCYPNQLSSMAIQPGGSLYITSTGASPNGPVRFDSNVQGMVSTINTTTSTEIRATTDATTQGSSPLNMNRGVGTATITGNNPSTKLFYSVPTAIAWRPTGTDAWVAIQTADLVVKMTVDANGIPTVVRAGGATGVTHVDLQLAGLPGKAPFGLCFNAAGTRLYVNNFVTRTVTVVDPNGNTVLGSAQAGAPAPVGDAIARGAELFFTGRGPTRPGSNGLGVMSNNGWGACVACHPDGRTDNVTWMFDAGPRQTIPLDGTFSHKTTGDQRILNWSAVRDEDADFELNTRGVSGGRGLILDDRQLIIVGGVDVTGTANALYSSVLAPPKFQPVLQNVGSVNNITGQSLPALTNGRFNYGMATDRSGTVYMVAGQKNASTFQQDIVEFVPGTNQQTVINAFNVADARHKHGAAAVNTSAGTKVYVFGGYDTSGTLASNVIEFDPSSNTSRTVASMPFPIAEFGYCVVPATNTLQVIDEIHVVGGNTANENATANVTNAVWIFTPDPFGPGTWTSGATSSNLTKVRQCMTASIYQPGRGGAVAKQSVYTIGGRDVNGVVQSLVQEYQVQDNPVVTLTVNTNALTPMPVALCSAGIGVSAGSIYIAGGENASGNPTTGVFQFTPSANPIIGVKGPANFPSGGWEDGNNVAEAVLSLTVPVTGCAISTPPPVANFTPVGNSFRDPDQDAITSWIAAKVRSHLAPVTFSAAAGTPTGDGLTFFTSTDVSGGLGITCATCHGGPKWTRSRVDYVAPPSALLGVGSQQIQGVELRLTQTQGFQFPSASSNSFGVLLDVGTFQLNGLSLARINERRVNPADSGSIIDALGANGFNIPSLLSVSGTAPYYYSGLAQSLDEVFDGTKDNISTTNSFLKNVHHIGSDKVAGGTGTATDRANMVQFMLSIDETTPTVP